MFFSRSCDTGIVIVLGEPEVSHRLDSSLVVSYQCQNTTTLTLGPHILAMLH